MIASLVYIEGIDSISSQYKFIELIQKMDGVYFYFMEHSFVMIEFDEEKVKESGVISMIEKSGYKVVE